MTIYSSDAVKNGNMADALIAGAVLCRAHRFTVDTQLEIGDSIDMVKLPKGAHIIDCKLRADQGTTSGVLDVGLKSGTGNELLDGVDVAAADAQTDMYNANVSTAHFDQLADDEIISVTALGAVYAAANVIDLMVIYTMSGLFADMPTP